MEHTPPPPARKSRKATAGAATKERILQTALAVFNRQGFQATTVRDVAQAAGLSPGNLCYHYPTLADIIRALYLRLCDHFDQIIAQAVSSPQAFDLEALAGMFRQVFDALYAHRFLMLDFVPVMRALPDVQAHYRRLTQLRAQQAGQLAHALVALGLLQPEPLPGLYALLGTPMSMLSDFWISHLVIHGAQDAPTDSPPPIRYYVYLTLLTLRPYLTPAGLAQWQALWPDMEPTTGAMQRA